MKPTAEIIDGIPDEVLTHIIKRSNDFTWNFLAMQVILARLNLKIIMHKGAENILPACCDELRDLLKKSVNIPNSHEDLKQILSLVTV